MHQQANPLICDSENGICEVSIIKPSSAASGKIKSNKKLKISLTQNFEIVNGENVEWPAREIIQPVDACYF
ncbi:hypothetical protein FA048_12875 [Pedobacter polaris]|uniref:Uncharacterized protein n=1 Tax=Pedobacter polaris TaxID=2571273 RepID=A0A4U1CR20_9SPHI|nr:hypothetical protein [Pedobacter polaris]TKC08051.1 hypothetical protein FA048_12875 [Pedobacter polaris]